MGAGASDRPPTAGSANAGRLRGRATLADVVGLALALEARQALLVSERRAQDRALAPALCDVAGTRRLRGWFALTATPALSLRVRRVVRAVAWTRMAFSLGGVLFGWSAASALLTIRGAGGRISITACFAILVALPFVSWLATLVGGLCASRRAAADRAPLAGPLHRLILRLLPASVRPDAEAIFGRTRAHAAQLVRLQRALATRFLLLAGIGFGSGALAAIGIFVVFTDLAFGWSTTLDVAPEAVHRFAAALARPWAGLWPAASPSLELVEATRHFRVAPGAGAAAPAASPLVYGGWWPFLSMAIACYAVLPRLVVLPILGLVVGRECERVLRLMPGALELLDSLDSPWIESGGVGEERVGHALGALVPEVELAGWLPPAAGGAGPAPVAIVWAEAIAEPELKTALGDGLQAHAAGGRASLEADAAVVRAAALVRGRLLVCVRGDEPPLLELLDFLAALRAAAGAERALAVVLVGGGERDLETWRRKLAVLADPRLAVARIARASRQGVS
ncbi:MAG: DUF2868 domain-containing protein [Myxococcota bacterium]